MTYELEPADQHGDRAQPADRPQPGRVTDEIGCIRCGYSLLGLPLTGVCPECSTPVEKSCRGDLLRYSDPLYVRSLYVGSLCVVVCILLLVLVFIGSIVLGVLAPIANLSLSATSALTFLSQIVTVLVSLGMAYGWWRLSERNPAAIDSSRDSTARMFVRVTAAVNAGFTLLQFILEMVLGFSAYSSTSGFGMMSLYMLLSLGGIVVFAVAFFSQMKYLQWLGPKIPDPWVTKRAKLMMWLGPLLYIVGAPCLMLGPLVALILYYNMVTKVRGNLRQILAEVEV